MPNLSSTLLYHIRFLLRSLIEANSDADSVFRELCQFIEYGSEGSILVLHALFEHIHNNHNHREELKATPLGPIFVSIFKILFDRPNFSMVLCQTLKSLEINEEFLEHSCNALHLSLCEKIGVGLALCDSDIHEAGIVEKKFVATHIEELCSNPVPMNSAEQIQNIVTFLQRTEGISDCADRFLKILSLVQPEDPILFGITTLLSDEMRENNFLRNMDLFYDCKENEFDLLLAEMEKEMSMGDVVKELGCGCMTDATHCKEILSHFLTLTESTISKILGRIACNHAGLEDSQSTYSNFTLALGCNIPNDLPQLSSWDIGILVETIKELAPGTNWIQVMEYMDHEGFYIPSEEAFAFFMSIYRHACEDPFPLHATCGSVWKNTLGQMSFLKYAVLAPPEVFTFVHSARQLVFNDQVYGHKLQIGQANHAWLCLDLLDVLCQLAERGHSTSVRMMLEYPFKHCPEILLLGVSHVNTAYNLIQYEVSSALFPMVIKGAASGIIMYLWNVNPRLVVRGFVDAYNVDPDCIIEILDICQNLEILSLVLAMIPFPNGIRLAAVASRKELVDLEKWLTTNISIYKDTFVEECLEFLKEVQLGGSGDISTKPFYQTSYVVNIYVETCSTFLKVLKAYTGSIISKQLSEEIERLIMTVMGSNPRQHNNGPTTGSSSPDRFSNDVESEANSYFWQMFSGHITVDAMVHMLARFKESPVRREKLIFECMIGHIFEERKFLTKYPEKQLKIAALLFGSIIKHQLLTHLPLGVAIRGVLESLRKPPDSKMFVFGITALEKFVDRLVEWPQLCNHILQISHLRGTHAELVSFVERTLARISGHLEPEGNNNVSTPLNQAILNQTSAGSGEVNGAITLPGHQLSSTLLLQPRLDIAFGDGHDKIPVGSSNDVHKSTATTSAMLYNHSFTRPPKAVTSTRFGSALNIETLIAAAERRDTRLEAPASEIPDKISFIINNISVTNVEAKVKEFTELLKEQHYPWFAQYMVMKRASIEPNFHDLYLKFLDKVNSKALIREIVQATYLNCKVLLGSELIKSSVEERSLLKNLGSWLGKLTIGRNSVLRAREIDPKALIMEAYEKGLMIAVIPFTSKILEPCQNSQAYQPPNPWTMGILGLLAEIYSMPNLKLNLKFDIEVLFKNLSVDMKDVKPTSLLNGRKREVVGNPDFSNKDVGPQSHIVAEVKSAVISSPNDFIPDVVNQYPPAHLILSDEDKVDNSNAAGAFQPVSTHSPSFSLSTPIPDIGTHVIINAKLNDWGLNLHFQRVVPIAMNKAIKEIVSDIVKRSVSVATKTTKDLVLKDHAMESDESRIYAAAHLMVASLAGSLAHVACKEPLRYSISSQMRSLLQGLSIASELLEQSVQIASNDNLDLGCAIIERAATNKALQIIDSEISQQLSLRRKHRNGLGPMFSDAKMYTQGSMGVLPEALRPKPGLLSASQQRVYQDFVRLPWKNQSSQNSYNLPTISSASSVLELKPLDGRSGQGNVGLEQTSDVASDIIEPSPAALTNGTLVTEPTDGAIQSISENNFFNASFFPTAPVTELSVNNSNAVKEISSQAISSSVAADRLSSISHPSLNTRDALDKYQIIAQKLEALIDNDAREAEVQGVIAEVPDIILRCVSRDEAALAVAQKVFKDLYEIASNNSHVNACIGILAALRDVCKLVVKELTSWVIYSDEERKFNKDITVGLIGRELLNLAEYNVHMAKLIDGGRNKGATEFSISLIQAFVVDDSKVISELHNLVDALTKVAAKPGSPESLQQLTEIAKNPASNLSALSSFAIGKEDKDRQSEDQKVMHQPMNREDDVNVEPAELDPAGFCEKVSKLFAEWYQICEISGENDVACRHYVVQLHRSGLLKGDDITDHFFRILMELSVSHCLSSEAINSSALQSPQQGHILSFLAIDIYSRLVFSIFKVDPGSNRFLLFSKILAVTVRFIHKDSEKKTFFNPRPYYRLFMNWLLDFVSPDPANDGLTFQILTSLANAFHALQPLAVPGFSFAWLGLMSHRNFMIKLLTGYGQKGWPHMQRLLADLFQFLEPSLKNAKLGMRVDVVYKCTLRILLVLLHDVPDFLGDYHFTFCDLIPSCCIQLRNLILSAYPKDMKLPDPFTPNLKIDLLPEMCEPPNILSEVDAALKAYNMKNDVDEYLKTRQQGAFLTELKQKLTLLPTDASAAGTRYNIPLINSLVLYSGLQAIQMHIQSAGAGTPLIVLLVEQDAAMDIYRTLMVDFDTEGRYLLLNAVSNQLRYPNNNTHYFSFVLLNLFSISDQEIVLEQITRVLIERLMASRPHPWGLYVTFLELVKNPRYNFWNQSFVRSAPEIENLLRHIQDRIENLLRYIQDRTAA